MVKLRKSIDVKPHEIASLKFTMAEMLEKWTRRFKKYHSDNLFVLEHHSYRSNQSGAMGLPTQLVPECNIEFPSMRCWSVCCIFGRLSGDCQDFSHISMRKSWYDWSHDTRPAGKGGRSFLKSANMTRASFGKWAKGIEPVTISFDEGNSISDCRLYSGVNDLRRPSCQSSTHLSPSNVWWYCHSVGKTQPPSTL